MKSKDLTIQVAQDKQPWTVPYAKGVERAREYGDVPHILGSHITLHAIKTVGKIAAVFEALDHSLNSSGFGASAPLDSQLQALKDAAPDLLVAALRIANLYGFDLADEFVRRVYEKNGVNYLETK